MHLRQYIDSLPYGGSMLLAEAIGVSKSYLSQMASGISSISAEKCVLIEQKTMGVVTRQDLLPNKWQKIWPELRQRPSLHSKPTPIPAAALEICRVDDEFPDQ